MATTIFNAILPHLKDLAMLLWKAKSDIKRLENLFVPLYAVLEKDERLFIREPIIRDWLERINGLCYDIQDLLESWQYEAEQLKKLNHFKKVIFSPMWIYKERDIILKVKEATDAILLLVEERDKFQFHFSLEAAPRQNESISQSNGVLFKGREEDFELLRGWIVETTDDQSQIICVLGISGVGKTTLLQKLYGDNNVREVFQIMVWVHVDQNSEEKTVLQKILIALRSDFLNLMHLSKDTLLKEICGAVVGKNFLLTLDNLWLQDEDFRGSINLILQSAGDLSRIIITAQSARVGRIVGGKTHKLRFMPFQQCLEICGGQQDEAERRLREMSVSFGHEEGSLPRVANVLSEILGPNSLEDKRLSEIEIFQEEVFVPLTAAYAGLSNSARSCFLYLTVYRFGYEIYPNRIIRIWRANGLVNSVEAGEDFLKSFVDCFFLEKLEDEERGLRYKMPMLIHEFSKFMACNEFLLLNEGAKSIMYADRLLYLGLDCEFPKGMKNYNRLKSLTINSENSGADLDGFKEVYDCGSLRSIDIYPGCASDGHFPLSSVSDKIGKLLHMRHLSLESTNIVKIPESISNLTFLQSLLLSGCRQLTSLPRGIGSLVNLEELDTTDSGITQHPKEIGRLTRLSILPQIIVNAAENHPQWFCFRDFSNLNELSVLGIIMGGSPFSHNEFVLGDFERKKKISKIVVVGEDQDTITSLINGSVEGSKAVGSLAIENHFLDYSTGGLQYRSRPQAQATGTN